MIESRTTRSELPLRAFLKKFSFGHGALITCFGKTLDILAFDSRTSLNLRISIRSGLGWDTVRWAFLRAQSLSGSGSVLTPTMTG